MIETQELIKYFKETSNPGKLPYNLGDLVNAVRVSVTLEEYEEVGTLLDCMADNFVKVCPDKPELLMRRSAYRNLATIARIVDYEPIYDEISSESVLSYYCDFNKRGDAMNLILRLFDSRGIDVKDAFPEEVISFIDPELTNLN